jgi:small subunit ribosomal protein S21
MSYVKVRVGEAIDKSLRILKKKLDKEGTIKAVKNNRFYDKPSIKKRAKSKNAKKRDKRAKSIARRKSSRVF